MILPWLVVSPDCDDAGEAINAAFEQNKSVMLCAAEYIVRTPIVIPPNGVLSGQGFATRLKKSANIDVLQMKSSSTLQDLQIYGQGKIFSGRGIIIDKEVNGTPSTYQRIENVACDSQSYALHFVSDNSGGACNVYSCSLIRYPALTLPAIGLPYQENPYGGNRRFRDVGTSGGYGFDLGGAAHTIIDGCFIAGLTMNGNCRALRISNCRIGSYEGYIFLAGSDHLIWGNHTAHPWCLSPQLTNTYVWQTIGGSGVIRQDVPEQGNVVI